MEKQYENFPFPLPEEPKEERKDFAASNSYTFGWGNLFIVFNLLWGLSQFLVLLLPSIASTNIQDLIVITGGIKIFAILFGIYLIVTAIGLKLRKKWALYFVMLEFGFYALRLVYNFIIILTTRGLEILFSYVGSAIISIVISYLWFIYFHKRRGLFGANYELNKETITKYAVCVALIFLVITGVNVLVSKYSVKTLDFVSSKELIEYSDPVNGITLKIPSNWIRPKIVIDGQESTSGELVSFAIPTSIIKDKQPTQVYLSITNFKPESKNYNQTLEEFSVDKINTLKQSDPTVRILEENSNAFLAERTAYSINYSSKTIKTLKIWFIENHKEFEITYMGLNKDFDKFLGDAKNIINSLTIENQ